MDNQSQVVKHLEMIQAVINRFGHDSFLIKGGSLAILVAGIIFVARSEFRSHWMRLTFLVPVIAFWLLDGYFLWQERLFRAVYDEVRKQEATDFAMNPRKHANHPKRSWQSSTLSGTIHIIPCLTRNPEDTQRKAVDKTTVIVQASFL